MTDQASKDFDLMTSNSKLVIAIGLLTLMVTTPLLAQESTGRSAYWGTAARGMAGAFTAAGGDFSGISYNPANSATIRRGQFVSDFNQLSQRSVRVQNGGIGISYRVGNWTHGVAFNRTDLSFDFGNFSLTSDGLELNYNDDILYYNTSYSITANAHLATNLKYLRVNSDVQNANATGYGLDLGYIHYLGNRFTLGLASKNLIGSKDWDSGVSEDVPLEVRAGLRYRLFQDAAAELDLVYGEDPGLRSINVGGEWWVWRRFETPSQDLRRPYFRYMQRQTSDRIRYGLAFRSGVELETAGAEDTNFSMGLGMKFGSGNLDYSFQQRSNFDNQHYFGFSSSFGGAEEASQQEYASQEESDRQPVTADQQQEQDQDQLDESVSVGLLQWQSEPGVRMALSPLETSLAESAGMNISVYGQNAQIEQALVENSLSDYQKNRLIEETGMKYLVTGHLEQSGDQYRARVIVETTDNREEFEVKASGGRDLIDRVSNRIHEYIRDEEADASERVEADKKELPVPYSVRIGLLHWDKDSDVSFDADELKEAIDGTEGIETTVYRPNAELENSIMHNALSTEQTSQILDNVAKDYLVTGRISKLDDGYLATAYLLNDDKRERVNVMHSDLNQLVDRLSEQIRHQVTG